MRPLTAYGDGKPLACPCQPVQGGRTRQDCPRPFPTPPTGEVARLGALGQRGEGSTGGGDGCCWSPAEPGSSGPIWSPALTRPGGPTSWLTTRSATPANGAISVNASSPTWCRPAN